MVILPQLAASVQPNLVQHSREIDHTAGLLSRTLRTCAHALEPNRDSARVAKISNRKWKHELRPGSRNLTSLALDTASQRPLHLGHENNQNYFRRIARFSQHVV